MESKKQTGITLVALVITIVVLLILAGVSISLVLGQNGLISNAKDARDKTLESEKQESISLNNASDYIKQTAGVSASEITKDDYGKVVTNYNADGKTWEIFYADDSNIYLITKGIAKSIKSNIEIISNNYNGTVDFDGSEEFKNRFPAVQHGLLSLVYDPKLGKIKYNSDADNMKCAEYLLDSEVWNNPYKNEWAEWAIGAPTMELLVESYNQYFEKNYIVEMPSGNGYSKNLGLGLNIGTPYNDDGNYYYWLASPSEIAGLNTVDCTNLFLSSNSFENYGGIRPVVCLKSNITLKLNEDRISYSIE